MKKQTIELDHGTLKVQTKAYVFGEWAAHREPASEGYNWRVSHVPSGHAAAGGVDELDRAAAIAVARALNEALPQLRLVPVAKRLPHQPKFRLAKKSDGVLIRSTIDAVLYQ